MLGVLGVLKVLEVLEVLRVLRVLRRPPLRGRQLMYQPPLTLIVWPVMYAFVARSTMTSATSST